MRKKKIAVLHAHIPFTKGGAEFLVEELVHNLNLSGYESEIVSIPFKWYPAETLLDNLLLWRTIDLTEVNGTPIDLVIGTKWPTYLIKHPNKVIWLVHQHRPAYDLYEKEDYYGLSGLEQGKYIRQCIIKGDNLAIPEAKSLFTISQNVSNRLMSNNGIKSIPIYHPPKHVGKYHEGEFGNYIFSVGRLDKSKRIDLLIKSLLYCDSTIKAIIGGKGKESESLMKLARDIGVENRVEFTGFLSDEQLIELYSKALAVYFAPLDEDYGYISLEAFLSKKPLLTCRDSGGVLEFAENEVNSLVSNFSDMEFGQNIQKLYLNKKLAKEYGENGYRKVKDITWDKVVKFLTETIS